MSLQVGINKCVVSAMSEMKVSRAELARRLGVSRAAVTEMFEENWTLDRFQKVAEALGAVIRVTLHLPREEEDGNK